MAGYSCGTSGGAWGALIDHPIRRWNPDTGRQIASPIEVPAGRKKNVSGSPMPLFGIIYL